ncbi:DOF zinc finger protein DOF5.7-like protein [Tanacetum coccineum]
MSLDNITPATQHHVSTGCAPIGVEKTYWTKGGALRKVPIGGGCRKKKTRPCSSRDLSSLEIGGLNLFTGLSPPAMDFQLNGLNQFSSSTSSINPPPFMNLDCLRLKFPLIKQDHSHQLHGGLASFQEFGITNNLATSIESLSCINQDLHWKLQQQRRASLFSGVGGENEQQNHYVNVDQPQTHGVAQIHGENVGTYENGNMNNWNNGIQGWNDFNDQYNALP